MQAGCILVFVLSVSAYVTPALIGGLRVKTVAVSVVDAMIDSFQWPFGWALALILSVVGGLCAGLRPRHTHAMGGQAMTTVTARRGDLAFSLYCWLAYAFLLAPIVSVVLASFNAGAFLTFPPKGLSFRWYVVFFDNEVFRRIMLPMIKPGVIGGCLFAFIISFDTFTMSFLLKSVGTSTLPIQLFDYLKTNFTPEAAAVSSFSVGLTLVVVVFAEKVLGLKIRRF